MGPLRKIRIELAIFFALFLTYSYFHQGGGWNQNSRFAQVRSIIERGEFEINRYLIYRLRSDKADKPKLDRFLVPTNIRLEELSLIANTGDVSLFDGRVYPNKPPGTVISAVPGYFAIYHAERALGVDPDDWWSLTINAYLTTVLSVGLLAALGGVAFYRTSLCLFPSAPAWAHAASTLTFGMGTLVLPFATMLFDHDIVAALSLFGFWLLLVEKESEFTVMRSAIQLFAAGMLTGLTVVMNYVSVISVVLLTLYGAWVIRPRRKLLFFLAGVILPLVNLAMYHTRCFGSPWATANGFQFEVFQEKGLLMGMFGIPRFDVIVKLLFSGYRGLFFSSPVLIFSCFGFRHMALRSERRGAEIILLVAVFLGFLLMNSSFNHWHAGSSVGPRYLTPAIPFLSLPLTLIFEKFPRTTLAVAAISVIVMLLATAVDPLPFVGFQNPLMDYILPLAQGKIIVIDNIPIEGPVSANPIGVYESWAYPLFQPGTIQEQWNSFNLGEFLWPNSLRSLLPLLSLLACGVWAVWRWSHS